MNRLYRLLEAIGYPHPLHPQFTDIPIGMVFGAYLLGLLALLLRNDSLRRAARGRLRRLRAIPGFATLSQTREDRSRTNAHSTGAADFRQRPGWDWTV